MNESTVIEKGKLTVKLQIAATIATIAAAVLLPQIFHIWGRMSGLGNALGEVFLPMHLPVITVGFLAGPYAAFISGLAAPLISFLTTGMPSSAMLPFMMIELAVYGLSAGLLKDVKLPLIVKVVISQVAGRAVRAIAILVSVYMLGNTGVKVAVIYKSITKGIFGLVLQWTLIPLFVYWVLTKNED